MPQASVQSLQELLQMTQGGPLTLFNFVVNIFLTGLLSLILSRLYVRFGHSLSNRRLFAKNFVLIATTTCLIISIVKSSLALSLGLVGALSIVRFRAAIKEPEELAYLFLNIALGLGFGADQRLITTAAFIGVALFLWLRTLFSRSPEKEQPLYLTVSNHNPKKLELGDVVGVLKAYCPSLNLKRLDETPEIFEASFSFTLDGWDQLDRIKKDLQNLGEGVKITFLDSKGIIQ